MDEGASLRVLVVDPDSGRREHLRGLLAGTQASVAASWQEASALIEEQAPGLLVIASELVMPHGLTRRPLVPVELPQPAMKVVLVRASEGRTPEYLAAGFDAVLFEPVTKVELDRMLLLAQQLVEGASTAERWRLLRSEALGRLEVELLTLATITPDWLARGLEVVQRVLGLPALAIWELDEVADQLRCLGAVGLPEHYLTAIEQGSERRGREIAHLILESQLWPVELQPTSSDPRLITSPEVREHLPVRQAVSLPYREAGQLRGFISFYFTQDEPFASEELPIYDAVAGSLTLALAVSRARRELVASQRVLSELVERLPVGVIVCDLEGRIRLANQAAAQMLGVAHSSLIGGSLPMVLRSRRELPWDEWFQLAPGASAVSIVVQVSGVDRRLRELECRVQAIELPDVTGDAWVPSLQFLLEDVTLERRRLLELELLQDLTRMVTEGRQLDAAFRMVAERLQHDFGFALVGLALVSPDRQRLVGQAIRAPGAVLFNEWLTSRGVTGRALRENRSQLVVDVRADPDYLEPLPGANSESEIVVVLRRWGEPIGVLNIESALGHRLDEEDLRLAENVAAHLELLMEQIELTDRLSRQAMTDPLTGLANRRALIDRLQQVTRDRRIDQAAVLLVDFDDFKRLNDQHGHLFGDAVIQQVANRLAKVIRPDDLLARYAGDEFAVVLAPIGQPEAVEVAERLRRAVARAPFVQEGIPVSLTISIGLAMYPDDGVTPDELIGAADDAMYRAKGRGGNRVAQAHQDESIVSPGDLSPGD
jgi:diguanylate cyclase (GGDEF)-like protein/PAS domain S-box-containing protein